LFSFLSSCLPLFLSSPCFLSSFFCKKSLSRVVYLMLRQRPLYVEGQRSGPRHNNSSRSMDKVQ
jgi:hypothetical protein